MTDETPTTEAPKLSAEELKKQAIQAYYDAPTRKAKGEVVKQNPFLSQIFSAANHD